jgi:type IX secretion system PorP/SprF family membrane protein
MTMKKKILILWMMVMGATAFAQDPEFTQYYAAPLYLNPGFAGTASDHRFILNYRNQWPNISNSFITTAFSYDYNMHHLNSGVGILITDDKAGSAGLRSTTLNFQYAYKVHFNNKIVVSTGLNFGGGFRNIDFSRLVFGDQLQFDTDGESPPSDDPVLRSAGQSAYFDFGAGVLAYSKKFWLGFSSSHINRPNRSLLNGEAEIPTKITFHGGVRLPLYTGPIKKERVAAIMPSFVYKSQGNFDQLDLGTYFLYEPVVVGVWYRGIPVKQNVRDNISQDAVVVMLGFQLQKIELIYSYDFTVSELGPISGGAHEIALKYKLDFASHNKTKKRERFIPCPTFMKD